MTGETVYTQESLREFYQIAAMRMSARRYRLVRLGYLALGAVLGVVGLWNGWQVLTGSGDLVVILLTAVGLYLGAQLFWTGWRFYSAFAARALRSIPENARRCWFSFEDEQLVISNLMKSASYPYEQFGAICETAERFHFYINAYNGYILEKSGLRDGDADSLRAFLNSRREDAVEQVRLDD